jgi:putative membrane protein
MRFTLNRILIGTLVLPMLLGGLILWSLADRAEHSDRVPTAVVNLDKPVMQQGKQPIYAGRLLAGELTSPRSQSDTSLGWELTDSRDAEEGLADGDYYAVLTIPKDFSRTLSGIQGADPEKAGITVRSNDSSSALVGQISQQVGDIATNKLGHTITATYLEGVLSQTGVLKKQLGEAADGALQLGDGADRLGDGADRLGDGAERLGNGAQTLAAGLGVLSHGATRLSDGADRLAGGASRLEGGIGRLADGASQVDSGADALAGGLHRLRDATGAFAGQAQQAGQIDTSQLTQGVQGLVSLARGLQQACQDPDLRQANPQLCSSADQAVQQAQGQAAALEQLGSLGSLTGGVSQLVDAVDAASDGADRLAAGTGRLADGARRLQNGAGQLSTGASRLGTGADRLGDGASRAQDGATRLADGADALAGGADALGDGAEKLSAGADKLGSGLQEGADKIPSGGDPEHQAKVISDPVDSASSTLNPALDGATLLTPAMLAFALWLGAFVIYLVREGVPSSRLRAAISPSRLAWAGWWPALVLGAVQAGLLLVVAVLFGADLSSPVGVVALCLLAAAVFTAINQAFTSWFGSRRGWIISIGFAALQVVSLGGLLPIDTAPGLLRVLNGVLPIARASDAISHLTLGGQVGTVAPDVLVLLVWGVAALAVTVLAARRQQRITVSDVRHELVPA